MSKKLFEYEINPEQLEKLNGIVLQEDFKKRIEEIRKVNVTITQKPILGDIGVPDILSGKNNIINIIENLNRYDLDAIKGFELSRTVVFSGYDESKYEFLTLEGIAHITTHSLVTYTPNNLYPVNKLTLIVQGLFCKSSQVTHF